MRVDPDCYRTVLSTNDRTVLPTNDRTVLPTIYLTVTLVAKPL
jgi:hypothetical protein